MCAAAKEKRVQRGFQKRARADSNGRPLAPEASALSTELRAPGAPPSRCPRRESLSSPSRCAAARTRYADQATAHRSPPIPLERGSLLFFVGTGGRCRVPGAGCPPCFCGAEETGCCSTAAKVPSASSCAPSGCRSRHRLHHPFSCRPLARPARNAQVVCPARTRAAADRLRAARPAGPDGRHAGCLWPPALRVPRRRA